MPDPQDRVSQLYAEALARTVTDRADYLRHACAGDDALRVQVESLLAHASDPPSSLDAPLGEAAAAVPQARGGSLIGHTLGGYQILSALGAGGMGEVYRARDVKLGRDVAIKILPEAFASDADRRARFDREARLLATLSHPNIAAIYGVEEVGNTRALVLELVEGETLAELILRRRRGAAVGVESGRPAYAPMSAHEVLTIARQIAEALDVAHEKGIVHRDLKPANVKITPDGVVKVLDFGLAKREAGPDSPTGPLDLTREGNVVGTAAYMSPEQATGQTVDKRTDIWAFGCLLYEMLTGRAAFEGRTVSDIISAILGREPAWDALPATTPPPLRRLIERSLEKEPRRRLRDIADARVEIDQASTPAVDQAAGPTRASRVRTLQWAAALVLSIVITSIVVWSLKPRPSTVQAPSPVARAVITPVEPLSIDRGEGILAVSPDGRRLAYVAGRGGSRRLYTREIDRFESRPIPGTEGADSLTFSPDGRWLAFGAEKKIKKVALDGGAPLVLCEASASRGLGLNWGSDDAILFDGGPGAGIWRIPAIGGTPTAVTTLGDQENYHKFPMLLPDGKTLVFSANLTSMTSRQSQLYVQSLQSGRRRAIGLGVGVGYVPTGHLIYVEDGTVFAVPFDLVRLELTGAPVAVLQGVVQSSLGTPRFDVSRTGSMVYLSAEQGGRGDTLVWVDRTGAEQPTGAPDSDYLMPRLAPDGSRIAVAVGGRDPSRITGDIWLYDLARETSSRITVGGAAFPVWTPDGHELTFESTKAGVDNVYLKSFEGSALERRFFGGVPCGNRPFSWSPDGRVLTFVSLNGKTANDIMVVERRDNPQPQVFLQTLFHEGAPVFSPDGRWIAYVSNKSGRDEIYMRPFPGPGEEWTLSSEGGREPAWARKTGELFYRQGDAMMSVDVTTTPTLVVGKPRRLFEGRYASSAALYADYDVTPDGRRLLMVKKIGQETSAEINVVFNWFDEVARLAGPNPR